MSERSGYLRAVLVVIFSLSAMSVSNTLAVGPPPAVFLNSIYGQVWGPNNAPVANIYMELQDELGGTVGRQRTSNAGQFTFTGLTSGRFKLKVITLGTDYQEQTQDVQIMNLVQGMSDNQYIDFHLKYDPKRVNTGSGGPASDVFMQEGISAEATKHYKKAKSLSEDKKKDLAIAEYTEALKLAPNYFEALSGLGHELVEQKRFSEALTYLIPALDLNQRSFTTYYDLGFACYQLNQFPQAVAAARAATVLRSQSFNAQLLLGSALRSTGSLVEAEKALLKARSIDPKVAAVNWQLALVYNRMKKNLQAADELEAFLRNQPEAKDRKEVEELIAKLRTAKAVEIK